MLVLYLKRYFCVGGTQTNSYCKILVVVHCFGYMCWIGSSGRINRLFFLLFIHLAGITHCCADTGLRDDCLRANACTVFSGSEDGGYCTVVG